MVKDSVLELDFAVALEQFAWHKQSPLSREDMGNGPRLPSGTGCFSWIGQILSRRCTTGKLLNGLPNGVYQELRVCEEVTSLRSDE